LRLGYLDGSLMDVGQQAVDLTREARNPLYTINQLNSPN
jgi:hypothetical protein